MKKQNISIVVTVRTKTRKEAKRKLTGLMNTATNSWGTIETFPEWGFHDEYKLAGERVKK